MVKGRRGLGERGELAAKAYLQALGYRILLENYTTPAGEVDLIAKDGEVLVFVEVKARSSSGYGPPEAAVTPWKQRQIARAAERYLLEAGLKETACRFDVVAVTFSSDEGSPQITLIKDAFWMERRLTPPRRR
ncbi:MAG: YraN family protein [candidate division NC10 bacterium]|nr:YraN family protein [candidate division NC10 bacterium]